MTTLCLDFDRRIPPKLVPRVTQCCRMWGWPLAAIRYDRTRRGWHVLVTVDGEIDPACIVAAQAILGSDTNREMFNLMRVQELHRMPAYWRDRWNVLYVEHVRGVKITNT